MKSTPLRTALAVTALVCALGVAGAAAARSGSHHRGPGDLEEKVARLDLSTEAETAVYAVLDEARPTQRKLRSQLRDAHEALKALLEADAVDEAAAMAQVDTIGSLSTESRKHDLRTLLRVRALLSPDELEQLEKHRRHRSRK